MRALLPFVLFLFATGCVAEESYELEALASEECHVFHYELASADAEFTLVENADCPVLLYDGYLELYAAGDWYYPDGSGCVAIVDGSTRGNLSLFMDHDLPKGHEPPRIVELDIAGYRGGTDEWQPAAEGPFSCEFYGSLAEAVQGQ